MKNVATGLAHWKSAASPGVSRLLLQELDAANVEALERRGRACQDIGGLTARYLSTLSATAS